MCLIFIFDVCIWFKIVRFVFVVQSKFRQSPNWKHPKKKNDRNSSILLMVLPITQHSSTEMQVLVLYTFYKTLYIYICWLALDLHVATTSQSECITRHSSSVFSASLILLFSVAFCPARRAHLLLVDHINARWPFRIRREIIVAAQQYT